MAMRKKGILFTIGMTLLVLTIFTLSVLIYKNYKASEERTSDILFIERTSNLFSSVENSIRTVYYNTSFMDIRANGTRVVFYPFSFTYQNNFITYSSGIKNFLFFNYTMVNITLNYSPSDFGFFVKNSSEGELLNYTVNSTVGVSTGTGTITQNISRIIIYYYSPNQNGTAQWISTSNGGLSVSIIAEGNGSYRSEATANLDPNAISTGRITGLDGDFNVTLNAAIVQIQTNATGISNSYNSFYYSPTVEKVYIPALITVDFNGKVRKSNFARIM